MQGRNPVNAMWGENEKDPACLGTGRVSSPDIDHQWRSEDDGVGGTRSWRQPRLGGMPVRLQTTEPLCSSGTDPAARRRRKPGQVANFGVEISFRQIDFSNDLSVAMTGPNATHPVMANAGQKA